MMETHPPLLRLWVSGVIAMTLEHCSERNSQQKIPPSHLVQSSDASPMWAGLLGAGGGVTRGGQWAARMGRRGTDNQHVGCGSARRGPVGSTIDLDGRRCVPST